MSGLVFLHHAKAVASGLLKADLETRVGMR
jgi:hypothetical protein